MLRYGRKKHASQDELSAGRSPHRHVKSTVLVSSAVNSPRLNRVDGVFPLKPLFGPSPGRESQFSLLCGSKPQEDDETSELTRDRAVRKSRTIRLDPETKAMLMALLAKDPEKARQIIYECWYRRRMSDEDH